jgi:hypothetical protein
VVEKNKVWSALASGLESLRLGESIGVVGLKAEMSLIFTLLPLIIRDPSMVCIFPLYQPFINPLFHHSIIPCGLPRQCPQKAP